MPIAIPVTKTVISSTAFGIPVANEVNRLTTWTTPSAWTNLTFSNGWSAAGGFQVPQYRKIGDIVYLRGTMNSGTMSVAASTLPSGFRPTSLMEWGVSLYQSTPQGYASKAVRVNTDGTIVVFGDPASGINSVGLHTIFFSTSST